MSDQRIEETELGSAASTDEPTPTSDAAEVAPAEAPDETTNGETGTGPADSEPDSEPAEDEPTDSETAEDEPADDELAAKQTTDDEPADDELAAKQTTDDEPADDEFTDDHTAEDRTTGGRRPGGRKAQLEREGEVAADFLETLLDICDLDGDLEVDIDGDRAAVAIVDSEDGRVPRRLVGQDAQVLEALQELTRLAVQSETGERSRLMLDVGGHRAQRRASLVTLAQEAVAEVKESGEAKALSPMTAFERKVVHDEVLAAGLVSESEGSEPRRHVVISPSV